MATAGAASLNNRTLWARSDGAVLGRDATGVDGAATAQRGAFLTEDRAVRPATSTTGEGAANTASWGAAAGPGRHSPVPAGVGAQASPASDGRSRSWGGCVAAQARATSDGWRRGGRRRVAAERVAVAAQDCAAALAADA